MIFRAISGNSILILDFSLSQDSLSEGQILSPDHSHGVCLISRVKGDRAVSRDLVRMEDEKGRQSLLFKVRGTGFLFLFDGFAGGYERLFGNSFDDYAVIRPYRKRDQLLDAQLLWNLVDDSGAESAGAAGAFSGLGLEPIDPNAVDPRRVEQGQLEFITAVQNRFSDHVGRRWHFDVESMIYERSSTQILAWPHKKVELSTPWITTSMTSESDSFTPRPGDR